MSWNKQISVVHVLRIDKKEIILFRLMHDWTWLMLFKKLLVDCQIAEIWDFISGEILFVTDTIVLWLIIFFAGYFIWCKYSSSS